MYVMSWYYRCTHAKCSWYVFYIRRREKKKLRKGSSSYIKPPQISLLCSCHANVFNETHLLIMSHIQHNVVAEFARSTQLLERSPSPSLSFNCLIFFSFSSLIFHDFFNYNSTQLQRLLLLNFS